MRLLNLAKGLGLALFTFLSCAQAQIQNGSFENGLTGWETNGPGIGLSDFPGSGSSNAVIIGGGDVSGCVLSQQFAVTNGLNELHFDMSILGGDLAVLNVQLMTPDATLLGSATFHVTTAESGPETWIHQSAPFYIPENVSEVVVRFMDASPISGYGVDPVIDLVEMVPVPLHSGIQNGGFEDGLNGWQALTLGVGVSDEPPGYHSPHRATLGGGDVYASQLIQYFGTSPGQHALRMEWAVSGDPELTGQMEVWITSGDGEVLATRSFTNVTSDPVQWQTIEVPFEIPSGMTVAAVYLIDRSPNFGIAVDPLVDNVRVGPAISTVSDLNGDLGDDLIWQHKTTGEISVRYLTNGTNYGNAAYLPFLGAAWRLQGLADLNDDAQPDFVWRNNSNGRLVAWYMNGANYTGEQVTVAPGHSLGTDWRLAAIRDFTGDGQADLLWQHRDNRLRVWEMKGPAYVRSFPLKSTTAGWSALLAADFNGDAETDLVFQHADGRLAVRLLQKGGTLRSVTLPRPAAGVRLVGRSDLNRDGYNDLIFMSSTGQVSAWLMEGTAFQKKIVLRKASAANTAWRLAAPR